LVGHEIVAAIEARDWLRFAACLTPQVAFRAVVPSVTVCSGFRDIPAPLGR
jgi:hypothetical protein